MLNSAHSLQLKPSPGWTGHYAHGYRRLFMRTIKYLTTLIFLIALPAFSQVDLVKVIKSERTMYLLEGDIVVKKYSIALGANPKGHKQQEGDQRTPEGEYTLDYIKEDSAFYRAMHISYPNDNDIANAKKLGVPPGGFVMIHGQPNWLDRFSRKNRRRDWTDGCIALTNAEMDEFIGLVNVGTRILIEW